MIQRAVGRTDESEPMGLPMEPALKPLLSKPKSLILERPKLGLKLKMGPNGKVSELNIHENVS